MKHRRKFWVVLGVLLMGIVLTLASLFNRAPAETLESRFVGFSYGARRPELGMQPELLASLAISNRTDRAVRLMRAAPQTERGGEWPKNLQGVLIYQGTVAGHQERVISVPVPKGGEPWRTPLIWCFEPSKLAVFVLRAKAAYWMGDRRFKTDPPLHTNFSVILPAVPKPSGEKNHDG